MGIIKKIFNNVNIKVFKRYLLISVVFIIVLLLINSYNFIQARYESRFTATSKPNIAFFIVDVGTQTGQIELEGIVPRDDSYVYCFSVSNYNNDKHADVDLKYNIEIITTTNLPLEYAIYSDNALRTEIPYDDNITTNKDGVYLRHLSIDNTETMAYRDNVINYYYLVVNFDKMYSTFYNDYPGLIELVDIKINAEQDVSS